MLDLYIVISVALSLLIGELTGYLTGGMISAGYLALFAQEPLRIVTTLLLSLFIYGLARLLGGFTFLYSRRRFALIIMMSMVLGLVLNNYLFALLPTGKDLRIIGKIVPGLIANDMYRQGALKTTIMVLLISALVFLLASLTGL